MSKPGVFFWAISGVLPLVQECLPSQPHQGDQAHPRGMDASYFHNYSQKKEVQFPLSHKIALPVVRAHPTFQPGLWVQVHPNNTTETVRENKIKTRKEERKTAFRRTYLISRPSLCTRTARQSLQNSPDKVNQKLRFKKQKM